jgi:hypothetical protein
VLPVVTLPQKRKKNTVCLIEKNSTEHKKEEDTKRTKDKEVSRTRTHCGSGGGSNLPVTYQYLTSNKQWDARLPNKAYYPDPSMGVGACDIFQ